MHLGASEQNGRSALVLFSMEQGFRRKTRTVHYSKKKINFFFFYDSVTSEKPVWAVVKYTFCAKLLF